MNPNSPDDWQTLFNGLPIDVTVEQQKSQDLKQQVLQAYDDRAESGWWTNRLSKTGHYLMTHKTPRWAATAAVLLLAAWIFVSPGTRPTFAMEKLCETFLNARNVRLVMTAKSKGLPPSESKIYYAEPGKMRIEMDAGIGEIVSICDFEFDKAIVLYSQGKTASVMDLANVSDAQRKEFQENGFTRLRTQIHEAMKNPETNIKPIGEKEIDGRKLIGFQFRVPLEPKAPMTVWADAETHHPYLIESVDESEGPFPIKITMSKFEFDVELDEALFSLEAPAGYQRTDETLDFSKPLEDLPELSEDWLSPQEDDFVESMVMYNGASGGQFPNDLSYKSMFDYAKFVGEEKALIKKEVVGKDGQPDPALLKDLEKFYSGIQFADLLPADAKPHYAGKGVFYGKSDQAIFWYWLEEDQTWRVLDANLKFSNAPSAPDVEGAMPHPTLDAQ